MFDDRTDAGRHLADRLTARSVAADVVLAVPRGGLPVGRVVADRLDVPLDIVSARKMGAPWNPELAIGAVASDGSVWLNEELIADANVADEYIEEVRTKERQAAQDRLQRYREDRAPIDLTDQRVVIVDDGIATGATMIACVRQVQAAGAAAVVVAVPVAPPETVATLSEEADDVVVVETPGYFGAVGRFYRSFGQVSDEQARTYLR